MRERLRQGDPLTFAGIFALLGLIFGIAWWLTRDTGPSHAPALPATPAGRFALPAGGVVIRAVVNNGPVAPAAQTGYEIAIDADGHAITIVTPPGGSRFLASPAARLVTTTVDLGTAGLQRLLQGLSGLGFFALPQARALDPAKIPVGGPVSAITITLADGTWMVQAAGLSADDAARLQRAQTLIDEAVHPAHA